MSTYNHLQELHQQLLARRESSENPQALRQAVQEYIEQARSQAREISRPRDRDQLRANLRFWGTFLYDETGVYPDTDLSPASSPSPEETGKSATGSDVIDLPGPIGLPRGVLGVGVTIIVLLLILLVVVLPRGGQQSPAEMATGLVTQESLNIIQSTDISRVKTAVSIPTITPLPPTGTPTITPTPNATYEVINVVKSQFTLAAATEMAASPEPTLPSIIVLPPEGGGGDSYWRTALIATVSTSPNPDGCEQAVILVNFDLDTDKTLPESPKEAIQALTPQDFQISIRPVGAPAGQVTSLGVDRDGIATVNAGSTAANTAYWVQVDRGNVTTSDVIVQFDATCSQNQIVTYQWQALRSAIPTEPTNSDQLSLSWDLATWGPAPQLSGEDSTSWIATFNLFATGGDGQSVFWVYRGTQFEPIADNQLILYSHAACEPATAVVGVTSGGLSVIREIVLLSPSCQKQADASSENMACTPQATVQENAICRNGPGTIYDAVTSYKADQLLALKGRNPDASWLWVLMPDSRRNCWISAELLAVNCGIDDLPIVNAPSTPTGIIPTSTPSPANTPMPTDTPTATNTVSPG